MTILNDCAAFLDRVRQRSPLVHHLTNYVTVNDCANITLAVGGSPIMATAMEEVEEIASISSAVVINIGTLDSRTIESMLAAGKKANALGIPVVFDPVGAGASSLRSATTTRILNELKVSVIRGNISEIRASAGLVSHTKGVDAGSDDKSDDAGQVAAGLAEKMDCVVAVTGARDVVTDGRSTVLVDNGHPMLSKITGTGCMCTSLVGSFAGANPDNPLTATVAAIVCMGIAGEKAFDRAGNKGLGSLHEAILDAVSQMDGGTIVQMGKTSEADS